MKKTKQNYEKWLNEIGKSLSKEEFWFGGKNHHRYGKYGTSMRKHDPIAFEVGFREFHP